MIDFPNTPSVGSTFTAGGKTWQWDGSKWVAASSSSVYPPNANVGRNLLHNGLFTVAQRGAGPFTATGYTLDRWALSATTDTNSVTLMGTSGPDRAGIGDETARLMLQDVFTGSAAAGAFTYIRQPIEGLMRLSAKTVTISFWAKAASGTLRVGINLLQHFGTGGSPASPAWVLATGNAVTIGTAWARYSSTIAVSSIGTNVLGSNGDDRTELGLFLSSGANTNALAGNIGVQSGTIQIWGVQLEIGSQATALEKLDPRMDLANCQRFATAFHYGINSYGAGTAAGGTTVLLPVTMRAAPTVTTIGTPTLNNCTGLNFANQQPAGLKVYTVITATGGYGLEADLLASADL